MKNQNFDAIIFDLGGVFLDIDFKLTSKAFIDLGVTDFDDYYTQTHASDLFALLETGSISPDQFYTSFRALTGCRLTDDEISRAWCAMLLRFPPERMDWLDRIAEKYPVFLFSNTNAIHYSVFQEMFDKLKMPKRFNDYFVKAYYSHEMGLRKPHPEAFQAILTEQGLDPRRTLFIDDTAPNIEGAEKAGLQTIHLKPPQTVLELDLRPV